MPTSPALILPFSSEETTLQNSGGKAQSLSRLARLGLPVPPGFILTTAAYLDFVTENALGQVIRAALDGVSGEDIAALERASAAIRQAFAAGRLHPQTASAIRAAYRALGDHPPVAVRSSATTEDLPDLSFAGQQDTYLNIVGEEALLKAVVDCWSSLWTARAIGYRLRNGIPHESAALAVVVQHMVASETSGVLFTANPLTGALDEAVIDATFGLGEALVSGQVEPDHIVVDAKSGAIRSVTLGAKALAIHGKAGGGVETVERVAEEQRSLSDEQVRRLVEAGNRIQEAYGSPQDIEWAFSGGELFILQSRPITSLFPVPRISFDPLIPWFSFGAVQGVLDPITPLGQEAMQRVVVGVGERLGASTTLENQTLFESAGERIWINYSGVLRNPLGQKIAIVALNYIEPSAQQIIKSLVTDPRFSAGKGRVRLLTIIRLVRFFGPRLPRMLRNLHNPVEGRKWFVQQVNDYVESMSIPGGADGYERLANLAVFLSNQGGLANALPTLLPLFFCIIVPAMASLNQLSQFTSYSEGEPQEGFSTAALEITRGLPGNVTTEMDLALWQTAKQIKADPDSAQAFQAGDAQTLADRYQAGKLPGVAQSAVQGFMKIYGMRGVGEIDLGQPRWREYPAPVIATLQSYMEIPLEAAPDVLFEKGARAAESAIERLVEKVRRQPGGWLKARQARAAANRVRMLLGLREMPKFTAVRVMGKVRQALLEAGADLAARGVIEHAEDLAFLHVRELQALAQHEARDWKALIAQRRQVHERERRRKQVPRMLVSDGRAFYEGVGALTDNEQVISGSPVSPGVAEGVVHVVRDPRGVKLAPGEILVCPGTDPAWTPLFMAAGGLVMETGGMMTHGSVVAREYGIPAVVGVHQATLRLKDGQRIRLDGTSGKIIVLQPPTPSENG